MGNGPIHGDRPLDISGKFSVTPGDSGAVEKKKQVSSGNMSGDNLIIADYNKDGIADGDSTGARPTLSPPLFEPTLAGYQTTLDQLEDSEKMSSDGVMIKTMKAHSAGGDSLRLAKTAVSPFGAIDETGTTKTITMENGGKFHADFTEKSMQVSQDGHQVNFSLKGDTPSATVDGVPVQFAESELSVLSDFFMLMQLFHEMGVSQKRVSRQARNAANAGVVKNIENQAEEQKKAAVNHLVAGVVSGTVKMASAGLTMAGAAKGMSADKAAANAGQAPNTFQGQMISQKYGAFGNIFEGAGEMGASGAKFQAAQNEAEQTTLRAGEEQLKHVKQTEQDQMQAAQELLTKARETFAQVWAQMIQTLQNQARNI